MTDLIDKRILRAAGALQVSFDLNEVARAFHAEISTLIPADVVSICISRPEGHLYDWYTDCPAPFFEEYPSFADSDFVAAAVKRRPNRVLRDSEMVSRQTLESNIMYRRSHELGLPIEHAMSTLVQGEQGHGGITLYRTSRRPFSEGEREALQLLVSPLGHAIARCRRFESEAQLSGMLEKCLSAEGLETVVFDARGREYVRSEDVKTVVARWFTALELTVNGLPIAMADWYRQVILWPRNKTSGQVFHRVEGDKRLEVRAQRFTPSDGRQQVAMLFDEQVGSSGLPAELSSKLTPRQREVVQAVLRGWDNRLIAEHISCAEGTVKKHLTGIFERLGIDSRAQLHVLARSGRGPHA